MGNKTPMTSVTFLVVALVVMTTALDLTRAHPTPGPTKAPDSTASSADPRGRGTVSSDMRSKVDVRLVAIAQLSHPGPRQQPSARPMTSDVTAVSRRKDSPISRLLSALNGGHASSIKRHDANPRPPTHNPATTTATTDSHAHHLTVTQAHQQLRHQGAVKSTRATTPSPSARSSLSPARARLLSAIRRKLLRLHLTNDQMKQILRKTKHLDSREDDKDSRELGHENASDDDDDNSDDESDEGDASHDDDDAGRVSNHSDSDSEGDDDDDDDDDAGRVSNHSDSDSDEEDHHDDDDDDYDSHARDHRDDESAEDDDDDDDRPEASFRSILLSGSLSDDEHQFMVHIETMSTHQLRLLLDQMNDMQQRRRLSHHSNDDDDDDKRTTTTAVPVAHDLSMGAICCNFG
ncbi:suppressor protein SRP40 [Aplysia californica]|uniref:Suppressor protein SRP40 n=1 Tax=Aplysia californica TaxID=6500 RepID=A0ABM0JP82_APLCA|nr:suppressor protein SRP40 [Aplysia californica]